MQVIQHESDVKLSVVWLKAVSGRDTFFEYFSACLHICVVAVVCSLILISLLECDMVTRNET